MSDHWENEKLGSSRIENVGATHWHVSNGENQSIADHQPTFGTNDCDTKMTQEYLGGADRWASGSWFGLRS